MEKKICSFTAPGFRLQLIVKNDNILLIKNRRRVAIVQTHPVIHQSLLDCAFVLFNRFVGEYTYLYSRRCKTLNKSCQK